jgi:hypothetical protein
MGGLCGLVASRHAAVPEPSRLKLLGLAADPDGRPLSVRDYALSSPPAALIDPRLPPVTVVCGTSMDAGKTHTVTSLLRGLCRAGHRVASIKLTGTASGRDTWSMRDAGAWPALDFIDGGFASTYLCGAQEIIEMFHRLRAHASDQGAHGIVMEIADGLLQRETAALLGEPSFVNAIDTWVLAAGDALGAVAAVQVLRTFDIQPTCITGLLTQSPLGMREAETATGLPCLTATQLRDGAMNEAMLPATAATTDVLPLSAEPQLAAVSA